MGFAPFTVDRGESCTFGVYALPFTSQDLEAQSGVLQSYLERRGQEASQMQHSHADGAAEAARAARPRPSAALPRPGPPRLL